MNIPRRSVGSLSAEAKAEARTLIVLTEGPFDKNIIRGALAREGIIVSAYSVDDVEVHSEAEDDVRGGNKGRLLRLSDHPSLKAELGSHIEIVIDDDGDTYRGRPPPRPVISTSGASLLSEVFRVRELNEFVEAVAGRDVPAEVIAECISAEHTMFCAKLALQDGGLQTTAFSTQALVDRDGRLNCSAIGRHLSQELADHELASRVLENAEAYKARIADMHDAINYHRFFELLSRRLHRLRLTRQLIAEAEWVRCSRVAAQVLTPENSPTLAILARSARALL